MSYLEAVTPALVGSIPIFLAWLVGIVLAVRMVRRGEASPYFWLGSLASFLQCAWSGEEVGKQSTYS